MTGKISFEEFRGDLTDEGLSVLIKCAKKRRLIYFLVHLGIDIILWLLVSIVMPNLVDPMAQTFVWWVIPISIVTALTGIFAGFGCFANNMAHFAESRGGKDGGIISTLWCLWGGLIIPLITLKICVKVNSFRTVLGFDEDKYLQSYSKNNDSEKCLLIDALVDPNNCEPVTLMHEDGRVIRFEQMAVIPYYVDGQNILFAVLKPIDKIDGINDNEVIVFRGLPQDDGNDIKLKVEEDEEIATAIFEKYKKLIK